MDRHQRLLNRILDGSQLANIRFDDVRSLLARLGFEERVRGSHHTYAKAGTTQKVNLQRRGSDAKPYQLRQLRQVLIKLGIRAVTGGE